MSNEISKILAQLNSGKELNKEQLTYLYDSLVAEIKGIVIKNGDVESLAPAMEYLNTMELSGSERAKSPEFEKFKLGFDLVLEKEKERALKSIQNQNGSKSAKNLG